MQSCMINHSWLVNSSEWWECNTKIKQQLRSSSFSLPEWKGICSRLTSSAVEDALFEWSELFLYQKDPPGCTPAWIRLVKEGGMPSWRGVQGLFLLCFIPLSEGRDKASRVKNSCSLKPWAMLFHGTCLTSGGIKSHPKCFVWAEYELGGKAAGGESISVQPNSHQHSLCELATLHCFLLIGLSGAWCVRLPELIWEQ